jgi:hypothetical protein
VVFLHQIQSIESSNLHDQRSSTIARGFNLSHRPNLVRPFCSFRKKETCLSHSNPLIPQKRHLFGGFTFYGKVSDDSSPKRVANQKTNLSLNRFIRVGKRGACKPSKSHRSRYSFWASLNCRTALSTCFCHCLPGVLSHGDDRCKKNSQQSRSTRCHKYDSDRAIKNVIDIACLVKYEFRILLISRTINNFSAVSARNFLPNTKHSSLVEI